MMAASNSDIDHTTRRLGAVVSRWRTADGEQFQTKIALCPSCGRRGEKTGPITPASLEAPVTVRADGSLANPQAVARYGAGKVLWMFMHAQRRGAWHDHCSVVDDGLTGLRRLGVALALVGWATQWNVRLGRALAVAGALAAADATAQ